VRIVALPAIKYERPANSALSEFAPENRFYANQRRVEIDQINMNLAKTEELAVLPIVPSHAKPGG
jgi:DEAD/DEAH box helicase domain-containing protein